VRVEEIREEGEGMEGMEMEDNLESGLSGSYILDLDLHFPLDLDFPSDSD